MLEWTIIYRLLEIPAYITEPSYYDLLDLKPDQCTPENVVRAFANQRNKLRQNIPAPQFISLITNFEQQQLNPAAETLADPIRRALYNQQLAESRQELERKKIASNARQIVSAALNPDSTLDMAGRPQLAEKLREAGLTDSDIKALFERIPVPAHENTQPTSREQLFFARALELALAQGQLKDADRQRLMAMARHLRIPETEAQNVLDSALDKQKPQPEQPAIDHPAPAAIGTQSRNKIITTISALVAIIIVIFIIAYNPPQSNQPVTLPEPEIEINQSQPEPELQTRPQLSPKETAPLATNPIPAPEIQSIPEPSLPEESIDLTELLAENTTALRKSFSKSRQAQDMFCDIALLTLTAADRAALFVDHRYGNFASDQLISRIAPGARIETITAAVSLNPSPVNTPLDSLLSPEQLEELKKQLLTRETGERYHTIEQLRLANSEPAVQILLESLSRRSTLPLATACRILRALADMNNSQIVPGLIDTMENARSLTLARQITFLLARKSGFEIYSNTPALLPLKHDRSARQESAAWWRARQFTVTQNWQNSSSQNPAWQWRGDTNITKLMAVLNYYADQTTQQLNAWRWDKTDNDKLPEPAQISPALIASLDETAHAIENLEQYTRRLDRILRTHDQGPEYTVRADVILIRSQARTLACDTELQKMAVTLDKAADLLALLVEMTDTQNILTNTLMTIKDARDYAAENSSDVVHELRETAFANLALWDLLLYNTLETSPRRIKAPPRLQPYEKSFTPAPQAPRAALKPNLIFADYQTASETTNKITELSQILLANPLDADAASQLKKLRSQQTAVRRQSLNALAQGLNAWLNQQFNVAAEHLQTASQSAYVRDLTQKYMGRSIGSISEQCQNNLHEEYCPQCGNTSLADCKGCYATGQQKCRTCRGQGKIRVNGSSEFTTCPNCRGLGTQTCSHCQGNRYHHLPRLPKKSAKTRQQSPALQLSKGTGP